MINRHRKHGALTLRHQVFAWADTYHSLQECRHQSCPPRSELETKLCAELTASVAVCLQRCSLFCILRRKTVGAPTTQSAELEDCLYARPTAFLALCLAEWYLSSALSEM